MKLPTPDELGEKVEKGEMTEAEAVEIMAERARRQALPFLYPPDEDEAPAQTADDDRKKAGVSRWKMVVGILLALAALCAALAFM